MRNWTLALDVYKRQLYEFVEDEAELEGLMKIFEELLDDVDIETKE